MPTGERPFALRRQEAGFDVDRAAVRLGCSPAWLRKLERGRVPLSMRLAGRMASAYRCSITALFRHGAQSGKRETGPAERAGPVGEWKRLRVWEGE